MELDLSMYCPKCEKHTELSPRGKPVIISDSGPNISFTHDRDKLYYQMAECNGTINQERCSQFFILKIKEEISGQKDDKPTIKKKIMEHHPEELKPQPNKDTPESIKGDLREALACFHVRAYRATGVMCRYILEKCCKDRGAPSSKNLREQIAFLRENGTISEIMNETANTIRLTGNDGAHPNNTSVGREDAKDILILTEEFISHSYAIDRIKKRRNKKNEPKEELLYDDEVPF